MAGTHEQARGCKPPHRATEMRTVDGKHLKLVGLDSSYPTGDLCRRPIPGDAEGILIRGQPGFPNGKALDRPRRIQDCAARRGWARRVAQHGDSHQHGNHCVQHQSELSRNLRRVGEVGTTALTTSCAIDSSLFAARSLTRAGQLPPGPNSGRPHTGWRSTRARPRRRKFAALSAVALGCRSASQAFRGLFGQQSPPSATPDRSPGRDTRHPRLILPLHRPCRRHRGSSRRRPYTLSPARDLR